MTRRFNRWLLMAIILSGLPFWWLLIANDGGGGPAKPVHIADLRKLAAIVHGARPTAVTYTLLATRLSVGDYFVAGIGMKRQPLAIVTWSLPVPDKGPIVIDPGLPPAEAQLGKFSNIDHGKLSQIHAETRLASLILFTQGHVPAPSPTAGTARAPYLLGGKAGMVTLASRMAAMAAREPTSYTTAQAVAPGVVVIPTTSHARNTRLIFVALADGREFLFTGDVAMLYPNWAQLRIRSHLAALWGPSQDAGETYAWQRTIRQLHSEAPQMQIVPGHDYVWLTRQAVGGIITEMQPAAPPRPRHPR